MRCKNRARQSILLRALFVPVVGAAREPPLITPQHHFHGRFTNRPYESVEMPQCLPLGFTNSGNAMGLVGAFVVMFVFIVGAAREPSLITPQRHYHGRFTNRPYENGEIPQCMPLGFTNSGNAMGLVGSFVVMCVFIVGAAREPPLITPQHHSHGRFTNRPYENGVMPQCLPLGFTKSGNAMGLVGAFVVMCVFIVGAAREPPLITPQHHFHGRFTNSPLENGVMPQ